MTSNGRLRIAIFSNDDLSSNLIFSPLFEIPSVEVMLVGIAASPKKGSRSKMAGAFALLRRMSVRYWLYLVVSNGMFTLFDVLTRVLRLSPRSGVLASLRRLSHVGGIPLFHCVDFSGPNIIARMKAAKVDLLVVRIGAILSAEVLSVPAKDCWCVHSSLLPSFKGIAGEFHALCAAKAPIGSTVFRVTPILDEGDPLAQIAIGRCETRSVFAHMLRNNLAAASLLRDMVEGLALGRPMPTALFNAGLGPSYWSWPKREKVALFRDSGGKLMRASEAARLLLASVRLCRLDDQDLFLG